MGLLTAKATLDRQAARRTIGRYVRVKNTLIARAALRFFQQLYESPKYGRKGQFERGSRPGEFPHKQSGELGRRVRIVPQGDFAIRVIWDAEHAALLEEGTARMKPRPYLKRTAEGALREARRAGLLSSARPRARAA